MTAATPHAAPSSALERVLAALEAHGCRPRRCGREWIAHCPAHEDQRPSLGVAAGDDGRALLTCRSAGCPTAAVVAALGLAMRDLYDSDTDPRRERTSGKRKARGKAAPELVDLGPPTDDQVAALMDDLRVTRRETLEMIGARHARAWDTEWLAIPALEGAKLWGIDGAGTIRRDGRGLARRNVGPVSIVCSPDLARRCSNGRAPRRIYDVEGESDLLAAIDAGLTGVIASTGGAGSLVGHDRHRTRLVSLAQGAEVVVVRDLDRAGREGARKAAEWWRHAGIPVRVLTLPAELGEGGDLRDYLLGRRDRAPLGVAADVDALADAALLLPAGGESEVEAESEPRARVYVGRAVLEALADTPEPEWLVPSLLRPGKVTVLGGSTIAGKTMLAAQTGSAVAGGIPSWPGLESVASGPVVFLGYDPHMSVEDLVRRLRHLDRGAHRRGIVPAWSWADRLALVGHSETSGPFPVDRYRLDAEGTERIAEELLRPLERQLGRLALVIVDTLSIAFPEGAEENDSAAMNAVMSRLSMLAIEFGAAVLTPHHPTKAASSGGEKFDSWNALSYFRGSSAIPSAAGVLAGLWAPPMYPQHRVLTCWSNSGPRRRWWFEVAEPARAAEGWIDYWLPTEPPEDGSADADEMHDVLARTFTCLGEVLSSYAIAQRMSGKADPSRAAKARAARLIEWATKHHLVEPHEGKHRLTADGWRAVSARRAEEA